MSVWDQILSALQAAVPAAAPLLYGTLGEVTAERSGVVNLGMEGMMLMGAVVAFAVTQATGNIWLALLAAALIGALMGLIHAFTTISLRVNQVVAGLALTMVGTGISGIMGKRFIGMPPRTQLKPIPIPGLSDIPVLGPILFNHDVLVYIAFLMVPLMWFLFYKTRWGISLRSVGEDPATADAMGVNVFRVRYLAVTFGGLMAGIGGAYLPIVYTPAWIEGMTAGAGWIVIALTIFAMWDPVRALLGAYLFGGVRILQYRLQKLGISPPLLNTLPFVFTILVLLFSAGETMRKRLGAPAALMKPYSREER